jgi:hypothetical protein
MRDRQKIHQINSDMSDIFIKNGTTNQQSQKKRYIHSLSDFYIFFNDYDT